MNATVKRFAWQWFVTPQDGGRGGIPVASYNAGLDLCRERGWTVIEDPLERRSRLLAAELDIKERRGGRVR